MEQNKKKTAQHADCWACVKSSLLQTIQYSVCVCVGLLYLENTDFHVPPFTSQRANEITLVIRWLVWCSVWRDPVLVD